MALVETEATRSGRNDLVRRIIAAFGNLAISAGAGGATMYLINRSGFSPNQALGEGLVAWVAQYTIGNYVGHRLGFYKEE